MDIQEAMQDALIFAVKTTERFMWSLLQFFFKKIFALLFLNEETEARQ